MPCEIDDDEITKLEDELDDYATSLYDDYIAGEISESQARAAYKRAERKVRYVHNWR